MQKITINDQEYKLPETWQEVALDKLPDILRLLYVLPENGSTYHELLRVLLGYKPKRWAKLMAHYFKKGLSVEQVENNALVLQGILAQVDWMRSTDLTVNPFPEGIDIHGEQWVLFEDGFQSMSFGELTNAHIHAQAFIKQLVEGEERLNLLVATVARPKASESYLLDPSWNGDPREPYNEHAVRHRAAKLENGFVPEKILVLMYFLGTLKEFFSFYDLFESDASGPPTPEDYPGQSMVKNQHLLSEKHIFGGMAETKAANVHDVFQLLEEQKKDTKAANARAKAQNNDTY